MPAMQRSFQSSLAYSPQSPRHAHCLTRSLSLRSLGFPRTTVIQSFTTLIAAEGYRKMGLCLWKCCLPRNQLASASIGTYLQRTNLIRASIAIPKSAVQTSKIQLI